MARPINARPNQKRVLNQARLMGFLKRLRYFLGGGDRSPHQDHIDSSKPLPPELSRVNDPEFVRLRDEIRSYRRCYGYYMIMLVDISEMRRQNWSQEDIAESVFEHFDDQEWPPRDQRPANHRWEDYTTEAEKAHREAVEALMGGNAIGHTQATIHRALAEEFVDRFESFLDFPRTHYRGLGLGDYDLALQNGIAVIGQTRAAALLVVESD